MARFKKIPQNRSEGKIVYGDNIVDEIVFLTVSELDYVELFSITSRKQMKNSAIRVILDKDGVHVNVAVKIHFTQSVSEIAFKIQEAVRHNVESMTEYHIASVNVMVRGVMFNELTKAVNSDNAAENGNDSVSENTKDGE